MSEPGGRLLCMIHVSSALMTSKKYPAETANGDVHGYGDMLSSS